MAGTGWGSQEQLPKHWSRPPKGLRPRPGPGCRCARSVPRCPAQAHSPQPAPGTPSACSVRALGLLQVRAGRPPDTQMAINFCLFLYTHFGTIYFDGQKNYKDVTESSHRAFTSLSLVLIPYICFKTFKEINTGTKLLTTDFIQIPPDVSLMPLLCSVIHAPIPRRF